jgi:hypothetical protein
MISTGTVDNCWWYGGYGEQKENVQDAGCNYRVVRHGSH